MDDNQQPLPKLLITYQKRPNNNLFEVKFIVAKSYDLITFSAESNIEGLNPMHVMSIIDNSLFECEVKERCTSVFESSIEGIYESHNTTVVYNGNYIINIDVVNFDKSKLRAFMLNENMMQLLEIAHTSGKSLTDVTLANGGKWIFKMD